MNFKRKNTESKPDSLQELKQKRRDYEVAKRRRDETLNEALHEQSVNIAKQIMDCMISKADRVQVGILRSEDCIGSTIKQINVDGKVLTGYAYPINKEVIFDLLEAAGCYVNPKKSYDCDSEYDYYVIG